jgi:hypothetical protein
MTKTLPIAVIGSANIDLVTFADRFSKPRNHFFSRDIKKFEKMDAAAD